MADFTAIDGKLDAWIDEHREEIVASVVSSIKIPSVEGDPEPGAPFGVECLKALRNVLDIAERYGLKTKMLDGYAGHAEFGAGADLIGVLSHVDVVPAGSDWSHDPFGGEIVDGKIYGRGAIDDKGPTMAGLYGMIAVKETGVPISKRFRHIVGADEESGFQCMHHYFDVAREEMPTMGFTPDGRFPLIYAEKGIAKPTLTANLGESDSGVRLEWIRAGERSNMVPDRAKARLDGDQTRIVALARMLGAVPDVTITVEGSVITVAAVGVAAHASTPELGINAVGLVIKALFDLPELAYCGHSLRAVLDWATDTTGRHLGIAGSDAISGDLTSNLGVLECDGKTISATFSIRHPVTWSEESVQSRIAEAAGERGFTLSSWTEYSAPLHVPLDSPLISTLLSVYRAETGDMDPPKTMGGGTYARVLKHGVAFGPNFPGFPDNAHQADEYWTIEDLLKSTRIYAKSLARLGI